MQIRKDRLTVPGFAVAIGMMFLAAQWAGGHPGEGFVSLAIMVAFGALIYVGARRSETIKALRGDGLDERFRQIDIRATAVTGLVLIFAVLIAFTVELARGNDGRPFSWLGAIGGITYAVAIATMARRG